MSHLLLVTGSRSWGGPDQVLQLVETLDRALAKWPDLKLVHGGAAGADSLAHTWALAHDLTVWTFTVDWTPIDGVTTSTKTGRFGVYDPRAGLRRNQQMLDRVLAGPESGCGVAFWDGRSRGTGHMIQSMRAAGLPFKLVRSDIDASPDPLA